MTPSTSSTLPVWVDVRRASGSVSGPPVVLLHGFASTGADDFPPERWSAALTAAGRDVAVVELPGHGRAVPVHAGADASTAAVVTAVRAAVTRALGDPAEIDLLGYSLGARLAWDVAARAGVRRLVLGGLSPSEPFGLVDLAEARAFVTSGAAPSHPLTAVIAGMAQAPGRDPESLFALVEGLAGEPFDPWAPDAAAPAVPTLFVSGADDVMAQGVESLAGLVHGSVVRVPGDHGGALHSAEFAATAIAFLTRD